jgi:hypothetical protein
MAAEEFPEGTFPGDRMRQDVLRDTIALEVLKSVLANPDPWMQWAVKGKGDNIEPALARWSYMMADAMLAEKSRKRS